MQGRGIIPRNLIDFFYQSLQCKVEDKVKEYFSQLELDDKKQLKLLTERGLSTAVSDFVDKDDTHAIADTFKWVLSINFLILFKI